MLSFGQTCTCASIQPTSFCDAEDDQGVGSGLGVGSGAAMDWSNEGAVVADARAEQVAVSQVRRFME